MNNPVWIDEKGKIIEPEYCRDFLSRHPMRCINERFYTVDGPLPDESKLKRTIYEEISPWLHDKVAQTVEQVIKALKLAAYADPLPLHCDRIHVANGTYFLDGTFTEEKEYCGNRLSVSYRADAPAPQHWLRFLSELLEPEDIPALQEYLGYCLIPSTKGQKNSTLSLLSLAIRAFGQKESTATLIPIVSKLRCFFGGGEGSRTPIARLLIRSKNHENHHIGWFF